MAGPADVTPIIPVPDEKARAEAHVKENDQPAAFSKRCALVMNSRYWSARVETAAEYEARAGERDSLTEAVKTARKFSDLPEDMKALFRRAERFVGRREPDEEDRPAQNVGLLTRVLNVFCATGEGGGIDPRCSLSEKGASQSGHQGAADYAEKVDLFGITDRDVKERVESTLRSLVEEYGLRLDGVRTVTMHKNEFDEASAAMMQSFSTTPLGMTYREAERAGKLETTHHLDLDREVWQSKETLKAYYAKLPDGYLADRSAAGMIRHEYAHALDKAHPESQETVRAVYADYRKSKGTVSEYSVSSAKEMVAEAFAHYHRQGSLEGTGLEALGPVFDSWRRKR